jgi:hypothetical protein
MNVGGVVKGGLLAGLVINVGEILLNAMILAEPWAEAMEPLGVTQGRGAITVYVVGAFVLGLAGMWIYAAARPRLGAGPGTALKVALVMYVVAAAWPVASFMTMGIFPQSLLWYSLAWEVVEFPLAFLAGAWIYKEEGAA